MNPQLSDFIMRTVLGLIVLGIIWLQTHTPFRDRLSRYAFPAIATACVMLLIHLPRLPSIVTWIRSTATPPPAVTLPRDYVTIRRP